MPTWVKQGRLIDEGRVKSSLEVWIGRRMGAEAVEGGGRWWALIIKYRVILLSFVFHCDC